MVPKKSSLIEAGCSPIFAKQAMQYSPLYNGNIEFFICAVEDILRIKRYSKEDANDNFRPSSNVGEPLDKGVMISELEYNGDLLNYYGYEYTINNRRG